MSQTTTLAVQESQIRTRLRQFWAAAKLGWAIESNWTDPFVFMIYQIVRPLFGALILVVMFRVIRGADADPIMFAQIYVGNAFFILVLQSLVSIGLVVFEDRERYEMIRYVYLAPMGMGSYLLARGSAHIVATSASILLTLALGAFAFGVEMHLALTSLPLFVATMALGITATLALGLMIAGATMLLAHHGQGTPEGMTGVLFLLSGVVFSIDVLPGPITQFATMLPWTYWLESIRRILIGSSLNASLSGLSDLVILSRLAVSTAVVAALASFTLWGAQRIAVARGKLDEKTDH